MNVSLLRKRYDILIIPLLLLLLLLQSGVLRATPACPIVTQSFQNSANGAKSDPSATGWYLDTSHVSNAVYFAAQSHRLKAQTLGGEGVWYSQVFSIAGYTNVQVDAKISSEGTFTSSEYVKVYYKLDNGPEILFSAQYGSFGTPTVVSPMLTGSTVQIVIRIYNVTTGPAYYYVENYDVFKQTGPCTVSGISVSASATNSGVLTCNTPSTTLSANSSASGVTYGWTGPGGFTGSGSSVSANVPGTYTVTGTSSAGTGSASVTVTANNSVPDLTATGANMACASSVVISASSSVSGAIYNWTGPGGFTGSGSSVSVSAAGSYTVTVKNPATGCTASTSVTVTSGTPAATVYWLEDFTLPNGTTSDAGATPWSATSNGTGTYTYSVQNNEFKTTFTGQKEGVWTSGVIDISAKSNTVVSVDLRSETANNGGDLFENADYVRVYLKINGRADSLIYEDLAGIGNSTTGTASFSLSSGALNGSTLQVIIKTSNSDPTERYYFDNVKLTGVSSAASVTASVTGIVTCNNTAQLSATATGTVTAYSWTGPGGFTSTSQNPVVSAGGQYAVTATLSGGCTVSAPVTVPENKTAPDITTTGGTLACISSTTIAVSSTVSGATYSWTGPGGFTGAGSPVTVSAPGSYTATVTSPANGCTASQSVTVSSGVSSLWLEDFTLSNGTTSDAGTTKWSVVSTPSGSVFSVQSNEFRVSNTGTTSESVWASDTINISGKTNVTLSASIRSAVTGTGAMNKDGTYMDYIRLYYKLNGGSEVLFYENLGAVNNHNTTNTNISLGSLSGNKIQIIVRARATGSDEFYYFDNVQVSAIAQSNISAIASAGGVLTCSSTSVALNGNASVPGVTYSWSGPGGFSSTAQNPTVSTGGVYTLTVSSAGCTASDTANVVQNIVAPDITATGGALGCTSSATISVSSTVPGATYSWTGPGGFTGSGSPLSVSAPGSYTATVTNPANNCTASQSVTVSSGVSSLWLEDFTLANGTTSDAGATKWSIVSTPSGSVFSVQNNEFRVSNTGSATGSESVWASDTINIAGKANVTLSFGVRSSITGTAVMNKDGAYMDYIRAYYKIDGGSEVMFYENLAAVNNHSTTNTPISFSSPTGSKIQIIVRARATGSDEFYYFDNVQVSGQTSLNATASALGVLSCNTASVTLNGSSSASGVTFSWTGPGGFTGSGSAVSASVPGIYTLTVSSGGCTGTDTANVFQNLDVPAALSVISSTGSTVLTCRNSSFTLTGSSSTPGVSYSWSGPGGLSVSSPSVTVTSPGSYILSAIHPVSGCASTNTTAVAQNITVPANVGTTSVPASGQLDCTASNVTLTGSSSTPGVSYSWSGPDGFSVSSSVATAIKAGTYTLTVMDPSNGCTSTATAGVTQNLDPPASVTATPSNQLTCAQNSATLTGFSTTDGATYAWTGPNGFTSGARITSTTVAGPYTLTVTNPANGCTAIKPITVQQNKTAPEGVSIDPPEQLNCDVTEITLTGHSSTSNVLYIWSGPNDFSDVSPITTVTDPGDYTLTVVNQTNGCSTDAFVTVEQDLTGCEAVVRKVSSGTATSFGVSGPVALLPGFTYKVYPNPVSSAAFVDLSSPVSAHVEVGIYNSMGVREKVLFNGTLEPNRGYKLSIDAGSFSMGIHFCIIKVDGKVYSSKLLFTPTRP